MNEKEDNNNFTTNSVPTSTQETTVANKKPKGNGGLNALLFIGSFLIVVGSCSLLMSAVSDIVKLIILLIITVVFYAAGLLIRRVKVLVPAGTAFLCTSLAVMPFMGNAFSHFAGMSDELSWFMTSLLGTIAYIVAALVIKSRIIATVSIGFAISLFCSAPTNLHMSILWNYLAVILVSIIANILSATLKEKIPAAYKDVLSFSSRIIASIVAFATVFGIFSLSGFDYAIIFAICFVQFVLARLTGKKHVDEILARVVAVPLILSIAWELVPAQSVSFAIITSMTFILEATYSLVVSAIRPEKRNWEIAPIVVSLVFAPFGALFVSGISNAVISANNIAIIVFSFELVLTIAFAVLWKNKSWLFASYPIAVLIPLLVDNFDGKNKTVLVIYAIEMVLFTAYYYFQKSHEKFLNLFNLIFYTVVLIIARLACVTQYNNYFAMTTENETIIFNIITLAIPALAWLIMGLKNNIKTYIEIAFYLFICCISGTAIQLVSEAYEEAILFIVATTVLFCLGATSIYRKSYWRAIVGTAIFAYLVVTWLGTYSIIRLYDERPEYIKTIFQVLFLVEAISIAAVGAVKRRKAIFWISAPTAIIVAFSLTKDMAFIWLILIGLALIGFVIWRLLENQRKEQLKAASSTEPPVQTPKIFQEPKEEHDQDKEETEKTKQNSDASTPEN